MATRTENELLNRTLFEMLQDPAMEKEAADAINDFTRTRVREDGFARRLLPPLPISDDELDRALWTDKPMKIVDKEPDVPPAVSVPFGELPTNFYIYGPKYAVTFARMMTPRNVKDKSELRTYVMDLRQVIADNELKDLLAEEDTKLIGAVNDILIGQDTATPLTGVNQWTSISGGITRDSVQDALKTLPSTSYNLEPETGLINNITRREFLKWTRDEAGGDLSERLLVNGWTEQRFMGINWLITIKKELVPTNTMFQFAAPKFIGKFFTLEDVTMYVKVEAWNIEWYAWQELGMTIAHAASVGRNDFE